MCMSFMFALVLYVSVIVTVKEQERQWKLGTDFYLFEEGDNEVWVGMVYCNSKIVSMFHKQHTRATVAEIGEGIIDKFPQWKVSIRNGSYLFTNKDGLITISNRSAINMLYLIQCIKDY